MSFPILPVLALGAAALGLALARAETRQAPDATRAATAEDLSRLEYVLYTFFAIMRSDPALRPETVESAAQYMEYYARPGCARALRGRMSEAAPIPESETWPWTQKSARTYVSEEYPRRQQGAPAGTVDRATT